MRNIFWMIAGILLALWLLGAAVHIVIHLLAWIISIAPLAIVILIIAGFFAGRKSSI